MGASLVLDHVDRLDELENVYELMHEFYVFKQEYNSPLTVYKHKQYNTYIARLIVEFASEYETINFYNNWCKQLKSLTRNAPNMFKVYYISSPRQDKLRLSIFYEWSPRSLSDEISERKTSKSYYTQQELWRTLESVAVSMDYLYNNNHGHGDIQPFNIGIDVENSQIKLWNHELLAKNTKNLDYLFAGQAQHYISPEQLQTLKFPYTQPQNKLFQNYDRTEVFSLGLTLLEMATLVSSSAYFNYPDYSINSNMIDYQMEVVKNNYSELFYNTLLRMLIFSKSLRYTFEDILRDIQEFKQTRYGSQSRAPKNRFEELIFEAVDSQQSKSKYQTPNKNLYQSSRNDVPFNGNGDFAMSVNKSAHGFAYTSPLPVRNIMLESVPVKNLEYSPQPQIKQVYVSPQKQQEPNVVYVNQPQNQYQPAPQYLNYPQQQQNYQFNYNNPVPQQQPNYYSPSINQNNNSYGYQSPPQRYYTNNNTNLTSPRSYF